ncbi:MAG TPA: hypothetical protein PK449_04800, partial [Exilispira sp.]|nr:hypothetical protein [Exilispira sp.]
MHIGIVSTGVYLPRNSISAEQIAEATNIPLDVIVNKFGVKQKPVALEDDTTAEMGIKAALKALEKGNIDASEVDLVIWFGAQHKDYPCWLAGLYIADRIGAKNAWSFDMEAMCGSFMTAIEIGKSLMLTREDCNTVLLGSGYRNNDLVDLKENSTHFMLDLGSGGTAAILKKNAGKNVILGSAFKGDGSFSTQCIFPVFGCKSWPV